MTDTISKMMIKKQYKSGHALSILLGSDYLKPIQRTKKRERQKYTVTMTLPTPDEMTALIHKKFTNHLEDLVDDAFSEIETLGEEMREWADNMPESLQGGDKYSTIDETANMLDEAVGEKPEILSVLVGVSVLHIPSVAIVSRADRCYEATAALDSVGSYLEDVIDELDVKSGEAFDALQEYKGMIQEISSNLEGAEFPGMFG